MYVQSKSTSAIPVVTVPPPTAVMVSLRSFFGAPCRRLVSKGDPVRLGQPIGQPAEGGAWVHAPVSGTVRAVNTSAVVIENDFHSTPVSDNSPIVAPEDLHPQFLRHRLAHSGILTEKQRPLPLWKEGACQLLILSFLPQNPWEPDPMLLFPSDRVFGGLRLLKKLLQPRRTVILSDRRHSLSGALALAFGHEAELLTVDNRSSSAVLRRLMPSEHTLLFSPRNCIAVWEAVWLDQPFISQTVLIGGPGLCSPVAVRVPLGTSATHILAAVSGAETTLELVCSAHSVIGKTDAVLLCASSTPTDPDSDGSCPDSGS